MTNLHTKQEEKDLQEESFFIPLQEDRLHLKRLFQNPDGEPVFMLHGTIENGRIFYSKSQKGLGPYLARKGYDVYIADLRGKGQSIPPVSAHSMYGQTDAILMEIPAFYQFIAEKKQGQPQRWIAHSWGGVLMLAALGRFPHWKVNSLVCFGSKRSISVQSFYRFVNIEILWNIVARVIGKFKGFLPMKNLSFGIDNEPVRFHLEQLRWIYSLDKWIDPEDRFDYQKAFERMRLPPQLHFAGINDRYLGHPTDVKRLMEESPSEISKFVLLSKANGYGMDYDHNNMLSHPSTVASHFHLVANWLEGNYQ